MTEKDRSTLAASGGGEGKRPPVKRRQTGENSAQQSRSAGNRARSGGARARREAQRRRRRRRWTAGLIGAMLLLGLVGLGTWRLLSHQPEITMQTYPVVYENLVRRYAAENDLPPAYVAAVILAESSYRPEAVSNADAQGLMQLLPDTAAWIAGKFDEEYVDGCLFDPETNIRYGCWYLGFLMKRYGGDMRCASSAYHAGQGNVDKWLQNPEYSRDGATLTAIPFAATDTYVQRVLKYYEKYVQLYAEA